MTDDADGADDEDAPSPTTVVEHQEADQVFELLKNDTRLAILEALFDEREPISFSDLREATGVRDSGQFSYHLEKLVGSFVRDTEDGYALNTAGRHLVGTLIAGEYTKSFEGDPVPVGADCRHCGGRLVGTFQDDDRVEVACEDCEQVVLSLRVPPGALEGYPREEWPAVAERWTRRELETVRLGFCPVCYGPVERRVTTDTVAVWDTYEASVVHECQRCGSTLSGNVEASLVSQPAVVEFLRDHGIDVSAVPFWELDWVVSPTATVVSEDPLRVEVSIELDGDVLALVVNDAGEVIEERRE